MATVPLVLSVNKAFKTDKDYHVSADLTGQANHLGWTIEASHQAHLAEKLMKP